MTRFIPHPFVAAFLFVTWLVLAPRVTPGQTVLAVLVAIGGSWAMRALRLERPRIRRLTAAIRLLGLVTVDILRSNIAVARIILSGRRTSNFLVLPLEMRNPTGLAILAVILTATPGTIWMNYDRATGRLLLHILDFVDEEHWIPLIKGRYERLLMEILD